MTSSFDATVLALKAKEVFDRNLDTLIAGFLIRHPEIDPSLVAINMQALPTGMRAYVTPMQIPLPDTRPPSQSAVLGDLYAKGWNDCLEAVVFGLNRLHLPPTEDDDAK